MKKNILYIVFISVLCFGVKAQAQDIVITDYTRKLQQLDNTSAEKLNKLIESASGLYVDANGNAAAYPVNLRLARKMNLENSNDMDRIMQSYPQSLNTIELIDIQWDGSTSLAIPDGVFENMTNLSYIYIRSQSTLSKDLIRTSFRKLIEQIDPEAGVEVLFYIMEEPR